MGLNRLLKKLAPDETLEEALYKKLTEKKLHPWHRPPSLAE